MFYTVTQIRATIQCKQNSSSCHFETAGENLPLARLMIQVPTHRRIKKSAVDTEHFVSDGLMTYRYQQFLLKFGMRSLLFLDEKQLR